VNFLPNVPTEVQLPTVRIWAEQARQRALAIRASERVVQGLVTTSGHELATGPLGVLSTPEGSAFVNAVWAADWAAYETEEDRVDYVWLAFVVDRFPKGFRSYSVPGAQQSPFRSSSRGTRPGPLLRSHAGTTGWSLLRATARSSSIPKA
jgi:hypothetical protein